MKSYTEEEKQILKKVFPFHLPSEDIINGTYVILDKSLTFSTGYHVTASSVLLSLSKESPFLIPACGLSKERANFSLNLLFRDKLPFTTRNSRRENVWIGRRLLKFNWEATSTYSYEKSERLLKEVQEIKAIYDSGLAGQSMNRRHLEKLFAKRISGFWLDYYVDRLPDKIERNVEGVAEEVSLILKSIENDILIMRNRYNNLSNTKKTLVDEVFKFIIQVKVRQPVLYMHTSIYSLLSGSIDKNNEELSTLARDPKEIVGDPRGVQIENIKCIYLPDEIKGSKVENIALQYLDQVGISNNRIKYVSELEANINTYDNCLMRYGGFQVADTIRCIKERKFVSIFDRDVRELLLGSYNEIN